MEEIELYLGPLDGFVTQAKPVPVYYKRDARTDTLLRYVQGVVVDMDGSPQGKRSPERNQAGRIKYYFGGKG